MGAPPHPAASHGHPARVGCAEVVVCGGGACLVVALDVVAGDRGLLTRSGLRISVVAATETLPAPRSDASHPLCAAAEFAAARTTPCRASLPGCERAPSGVGQADRDPAPPRSRVVPDHAVARTRFCIRPGTPPPDRVRP